MATDRTVYIVDEDVGVRRSLERLLQENGFATDCYANAMAFFAAVPKLSGGAILLDVWMPDLDGIELLARLRTIGVTLPVIMITGQGDVPTAVRAIKGGAVDFIEKPFDEEALLRAIEAAFSGDHVDRSRELEDADQRISLLSRREREVLTGLVAGKPNKVIAYELGLSVRTVEVHRARMMERLGVRQLAEAVRLAVLAQVRSV
jgi:two-component system, LuxR family, response regulator FixJ